MKFLKFSLLSTDPGRVADYVRLFRHAAGFTQQDLAVELGLAVRTIARWETERPPKGEALASLAALARKRGLDQFSDGFVSAMFPDVNPSEWAQAAHEMARRIVSEVRSPGPDDEKVVRVALMLRGEL